MSLNSASNSSSYFLPLAQVAPSTSNFLSNFILPPEQPCAFTASSSLARSASVTGRSAANAGMAAKDRTKKKKIRRIGTSADCPPSTGGGSRCHAIQEVQDLECRKGDKQGDERELDHQSALPLPFEATKVG